MVKVTNVALLRLALQTLVASSALLQAQSVLQITSPTNGTVGESWANDFGRRFVFGPVAYRRNGRDPRPYNNLSSFDRASLSVFNHRTDSDRPRAVHFGGRSRECVVGYSFLGPSLYRRRASRLPTECHHRCFPDRTASGWAGGYRAYRDLCRRVCCRPQQVHSNNVCVPISWNRYGNL